MFFKSWCGSSLQPISHFELLQKLNPVMQQINGSKNSVLKNRVGRHLQNSIRGQLDLYQKRLHHLEMQLDSHERRKSNTQLYSSLRMRIDKRNNLKRQTQASSRSFGLM